MESRFPLFVAGCILASGPNFAGGSWACGAEMLPRIIDVRCGFDGRIKVGCWAPVAVTLKGADQPLRGQLEVVVPDGDGVSSATAAGGGTPIDVPDGVQSRHIVYVKLGRVHARAQIRFSGDRGGSVTKAWDLPAAIPASSQLVVVAGPPLGVESAVKRWRGSAEAVTAVVRLSDADAFPDRWWGWEGVDTLAIGTSQEKIYDQLNDDQAAALSDWILLGGRMILCVGARGAEVIGPGCPFAHFAPGVFSRVATQRETREIERFAGAASKIDVPRDALGQSQLQVTLLDDLQGRIDVAERFGAETRPLIVRRAIGLGEVVFVGFDLDQPPFSEWRERDKLMARLLDLTLGKLEDEDQRAQTGEVRHAGYRDMIGQLRGGMDQFRGVRMVPFSLIGLMIVVYIVLIGPADYFFLRRFIGRMELTWLTLPLVVILFCIASLVMSQQWKGDLLRITQVDLVDVDVETGLMRGTMWSQAFSPRTDSYDLSVAVSAGGIVEDAPPPGVLLSWHGLPGTALSGMNSSASAELFTETYAMVDRQPQTGRRQLSVDGLPIQIWSSKSLTARWWANTAEPIDGALHRGRNEALLGHVTNPLDEVLLDCYLYYAPWAYQLGNLAPGASVAIDDDTGRRNISWRLTRKRAVDQTDISTPWDLYSQDIPRILEIMMFFQSAGGRGYTGLDNRYQSYADLTDHLQLGRAILVGKAEAPATMLIRDSTPLSSAYDRHWTFYRFVYPVQRAAPIQ